MASNFRILIHRKNDSLHLKLAGDFDGSSACELLNIIKRDRRSVSRIFVHCDSLKQIKPFGRNVLHNEMRNLGKGPPSLLFTGDKAQHIAPEKNDSV